MILAGVAGLQQRESNRTASMYHRSVDERVPLAQAKVTVGLGVVLEMKPTGIQTLFGRAAWN